VLTIVAVLLPLAVLRRRPWAVFGLLLVEVVAVQQLATASMTWDPAVAAQPVFVIQGVAMDLVVIYLAATRLRESVVAAIVALGVLFTVGATARAGLGYRPLREAVYREVLEMAIAWAIGNTIRLRGGFNRERHRQVALQAVQNERLRIARELHDLISHSFGVIAIQAGMGRRVIDTQPAEARIALRAIEDTSRDALASLRRMLTGLRRTDLLDGTELQHSTAGLADLDRLAARAADAGVRVDIRTTGNTTSLPSDVDLSAFRVIQEAVTNVVRHAGVSCCQVAVQRRAEELVIEVTDNGRGGDAGAGYGISGMRERIALLHGDFTAGPRSDGGFRVAARIPVPAGAR
jgi:signal transduction histidine kinase